MGDGGVVVGDEMGVEKGAGFDLVMNIEGVDDGKQVVDDRWWEFNWELGNRVGGYEWCYDVGKLGKDGCECSGR
jgi:hypothetical protein